MPSGDGGQEECRVLAGTVEVQRGSHVPVSCSRFPRRTISRNDGRALERRLVEPRGRQHGYHDVDVALLGSMGCRGESGGRPVELCACPHAGDRLQRLESRPDEDGLIGRAQRCGWNSLGVQEDGGAHVAGLDETGPFDDGKFHCVLRREGVECHAAQLPVPVI
jgi:hypothetical protein